MKPSILVIEDDAVFNRLLVLELSRLGYELHSSRTWREGQATLASAAPDLVILDVNLPDANGAEILGEVAETRPVIILTAYGSIDQAVDAMRRGAADYLTKPVNLDELELVIRRVMENARLRVESEIRRAGRQHRDGSLLVGDSPALEQVRELVSAVAPSDITVLIQGESGVGKELVAQEVHALSPRHEREFVTVDCCTLQETLFESELFGYERGAFTGADRRKNGLIDAAAGGTLFLDEIGEIGPTIQAKLLRVLESGRFRRVGGTTDIRADVRVVAATNRSLEQMVRDGSFRADLFYRLNAFVVPVPPLRERRDDVAALAHHFLTHHSFSRPVQKTLGADALARLEAYDWPGNIRELRNMMERAIILSGQQREITAAQFTFPPPMRQAALPAHDAVPTLSFHGEPTLEHIEQTYLALLIQRYAGNRRKIAEVLGVSERTAYRMLDRQEGQETRAAVESRGQ